eukprot:CAMPEP_0175936458 /NCGR_PEP_ID=MMETSP0108-20121206/21619_1 /TAXON_ID=195067 ORGANISM="Goniomonas pacifica, Strain CCMP1869" /NCGR_SAMPLE_ID=MMETSP0108 /ASSEMBLY_ACC=CAM_ASM_000204 /LENGTH=57 /DNA_ID=CAMNT_0017260535 /DNA_START=12 /DNA_END=182 /DNA_ORIENTATION=+
MSSQVEHLHTVVVDVGDECDVGSRVQRHTLWEDQLSEGAPLPRAQGPECSAVGEAEH